MKSVEVIPLLNPIQTSVIVPGSLSYTVRALNLAALTKGTVTIQNPLFSDDTEAMIQGLETVGIKVIQEKDKVIVEGSIYDVKEGEYEINISISGRTARSLLGLLTLTKGTKILTCDAGFKKRPVGELVNGLRQLGAKIEYLENENYLPVKISPSSLQPGTVTMKGTISSQFFSSILMIAPAIGEVSIIVDGKQTSKSFIDVTIETMKEFGVIVENNNYSSYYVPANQTYTPTTFTVEADAIASGYFWALAAITGSTLRVLNLSKESKQGDVKFVEILQKMGCSVIDSIPEKWIEVTGPKSLSSLTVNMNSLPDSAQTLAVVASFAKGVTTITGLDNARIKETDRIAGPENELKKMGIKVESTQDSITIYGGVPTGSKIETYGDHRMAMSFAIAGSKIPKVIIKNPEVVSKSFPQFWDVLQNLGIQLI